MVKMPYLRQASSLNKKSSLISIKNLISCLGLASLAASYFTEKSRNFSVFFALGFSLLSVTLLFDIFNELKTGIAKINYGNREVYYRTDPIFYWISILAQLCICAGMLALAFFIYTTPSCGEIP